MLEGGSTLALVRERLEQLGYRIAAYPLTLLSAATRAMMEALEALRRGTHPEQLVSFDQLRELVGFDVYHRQRVRYAEG